VYDASYTIFIALWPVVIGYNFALTFQKTISPVLRFAFSIL